MAFVDTLYCIIIFDLVRQITFGNVFADAYDKIAAIAFSRYRNFYRIFFQHFDPKIKKMKMK
jgi:hypothetical protein